MLGGQRTDLQQIQSPVTPRRELDIDRIASQQRLQLTHQRNHRRQGVRACLRPGLQAEKGPQAVTRPTRHPIRLARRIVVVDNEIRAAAVGAPGKCHTGHRHAADHRLDEHLVIVAAARLVRRDNLINRRRQLRRPAHVRNGHIPPGLRGLAAILRPGAAPHDHGITCPGLSGNVGQNGLPIPMPRGDGKPRLRQHHGAAQNRLQRRQGLGLGAEADRPARLPRPRLDKSPPDQVDSRRHVGRAVIVDHQVRRFRHLRRNIQSDNVSQHTLPSRPIDALDVAPVQLLRRHPQVNLVIQGNVRAVPPVHLVKQGDRRAHDIGPLVRQQLAKPRVPHGRFPPVGFTVTQVIRDCGP